MWLTECQSAVFLRKRYSSHPAMHFWGSEKDTLSLVLWHIEYFEINNKTKLRAGDVAQW